MEQGEESLSVEEFKKAIEKDPDNPEYLSELAFVLSKIKRFEEAEKYAEMAIRFGSEDIDLYVILGNGAKDKGEIKQASIYYKKALSDTTNYYLIINLAQILRDLDNIDEAVILLRALKIRFPFDLRVHTQLGDLYGRTKEFDLAALEFKEALILDSLYYPAILGLGIVYDITGVVDSSLHYYRKAAQLNPSNLSLIKKIVEFELVKGEWENARDHALLILAISPTETNVRKQLAYAYYQLRDNEYALEQYLLLSGLAPKDASVYHFLGRIYFDRGEMEKARESLNHSLTLNPDFIPNFEYLFLVSIKESNEEKALFYYTKLKKKGIKEEEILLSIGMHFYRAGDYEVAKPFLLESIEKNWTFTASWYSLGSLYGKIGNIDSAGYSYRKIIEIDSMNANAFNALGYMYVENNMKLEEAGKLIKRALEIEPENGFFIDSMGWLYFKLSNYEKAKDVLLEAMRYAKDAIIYDHLGDVYEKLGDKEKAEEMWLKSLKLDKENDRVRGKLLNLDGEQ